MHVFDLSYQISFMLLLLLVKRKFKEHNTVTPIYQFMIPHDHFELYNSTLICINYKVFQQVLYKCRNYIHMTMTLKDKDRTTFK